MSAIRDNREPERGCIFFSHIGHRALRMGRWKRGAVRHGRWKLYDMHADRSELNNLAAHYPEKVREMSRLWERSHQTFIQQAGEKRN